LHDNDDRDYQERNPARGYSQLRAAQSSNQQQIKRQQNQQRNPEMFTGRNRQTMTEEGDEGRQASRNRHQIDNQFSDQPDNGIVDRGTGSSAKPRQHARQDSQESQDSQSSDELGSGEDSINQPRYQRADGGSVPNDGLSLGARLNLTDTPDLMAAAQHHLYGAHYGSLEGHLGGYGGYIDLGGHGGGHYNKKSGGYHQYASSHKKGQLSQHKNHAEGHVKWAGKKGKGSHSWDYKHKNKKHYGGGYGYGGGHHHY
jgi:hypothetical protein